MSLAVLPHVTASLNAIATACILAGYVMIRGGRREAHKVCMISAVVVSALFLVAYGIHHFNSPIFVFGGEGAIRPVYYALLISHVVLAAVVPVLVVVTVWRAFRGNFTRHRAVARWTLPIWLYVSVTGVLVYLMLYHLYPPAA